MKASSVKNYQLIFAASSLIATMTLLYTTFSKNEHFWKVIFALCLVGAAARIYFLLFRPQIATSDKVRGTPVNLFKLSSLQPMQYLPWLQDKFKTQKKLIPNLVNDLSVRALQFEKKNHMGAHLLTGPEGLGKGYLAQLLAQMVFSDSAPVIIKGDECDPITFNLNTMATFICEKVDENPYRVIIIEDIDLFPAIFHSYISRFIDTGVWLDPDNSRSLSGLACLVIATARHEILPAKSEADPMKRRLEQIHQLSGAGKLQRKFLSQFDRIHALQRPVTIEWAELALQECVQLAAEKNLRIRYVDSNALVELVKKSPDLTRISIQEFRAFISENIRPLVSQAYQQRINPLTIRVTQKNRFVVSAE